MQSKDQFFAKYKDPRWQKVRLEVLERDGWSCQLCGATEKTLHVHHGAYAPASDGPVGPWDTSKALLYTVCEECHDAEHESRRSSLYTLQMALADAGIATSLDIDHFLALAFTTVERGHGDDSKTHAEHWRDGLRDAIDRFQTEKAALIAAGQWVQR